MKGFIETTLGNVVPYTNNGVTKDVTVLRPENQGKGYVRGGELAWNGFFDFLPGWGRYFGARAAYTYVESGGTRNAALNPYDPQQQTNSLLNDYPLEGLSRRSYNAELYYSVPKVEARLAYNWRTLPADDRGGEPQHPGVRGRLRPARRVRAVEVQGEHVVRHRGGEPSRVRSSRSSWTTTSSASPDSAPA